jgi:hypothetical protein
MFKIQGLVVLRLVGSRISYHRFSHSRIGCSRNGHSMIGTSTFSTSCTPYHRWASDIRDQQYRTAPDIETSDIGLRKRSPTLYRISE